MPISTMLSFLTRVGFFFMVMLVWGCASGPRSPESDTALLYLYWPASHEAEAYHYIAAVNGKVVARLTPGSYAVIDQPLGPVIISSKAGSALVPWGAGAEVGVLEGFVKTDQFSVDTNRAYLVHFPSGTFITGSAKALDDMSGLNLLPPLD